MAIKRRITGLNNAALDLLGRANSEGFIPLEDWPEGQVPGLIDPPGWLLRTGPRTKFYETFDVPKVLFNNKGVYVYLPCRGLMEIVECVKFFHHFMDLDHFTRLMNGIQHVALSGHNVFSAPANEAYKRLTEWLDAEGRSQPQFSGVTLPAKPERHGMELLGQVAFSPSFL